MPELAEVETQKTAGFVDRGYNHEKKRSRMEAEEEEIRKLEAEQRGEEETNEEQQPEKEAPEKKEADTEVKEETLSAEEKSFKKRYGDLRRHMQDKEKEWDEKFKTFEDRLKKESIIPPKSDEDIEQWAKEYPDVAGVVETIAAKKAQEMFNKAEVKLKELDKAQTEAQRVKAENVIRKSHEDFDDLRSSDEFHTWADEQPKWVQDALYENDSDARSASRAIDLYKADKNIKTKKPASTKDAARSVNSRNNRSQPEEYDSSTTFKESQVAKMSPQQYEKASDQIMEAIRTGKFVYDMSGSAR